MTRDVRARSTTALALAALVLAGGACTGKYIRPTTAEKVPSTPAMVARGMYLVNQVTGCPACHTPRTGDSWLGGERSDAYLAGGNAFRAPAFGLIYTQNLTSDVETGIGAWSDDEIMRAIRDGVGRDGHLLFPPMPFGSFQYMSDEDVRAIVAFLRTVPPIKNKIDRSKNDVAGGLKFGVKMGFVHHKPAANVPPPNRADKIAYGKYLALGASICHECHSLGGHGPDPSLGLSGSTIPLEEKEYGKVYARNLSPDMETGLGRYSADQIKNAIRNGTRLDGKKMAPPMSLIIPYLSGWSDEDLDALIAYMKSLPPRKHQVPDRQLTPEAKKLVGE